MPDENKKNEMQDTEERASEVQEDKNRTSEVQDASTEGRRDLDVTNDKPESNNQSDKRRKVILNLHMEFKPKKKHVLAVSILVLILVIAFVVSFFVNKKEEITYGELINLIKNGEISKIETTLDSNIVNVVGLDEKEKYAAVPSIEEFSVFISQEIEKGSSIEVSVEKRNSFFANLGSFISSIFLTLFKTVIICGGIIAIILVIASKFNEDEESDELINSLMDSTKKGNKKKDGEAVCSKVKFEDVAGIEEEKEQLQEIVDFLKNPNKYANIGAKVPRGVLLHGSPGTGKTFLAKAIAGEANVPFFQASGSEFEEVYVGLGASRVRKLFEKAKKAAPSIIFIDEIDSVAKRRNRNDASYADQTLNQILAEMDGFSTSDEVIVIAATNRMDVLDPAIVRPGRFDRHIYVPMPDVYAREKILAVHAKNKKFEDNVLLSEIAQKTAGFSGADLGNLLNEAAILAVKHGRDKISNGDIDEAIARCLVGLEKKNLRITQEDKWLTAVHEAGHAVVSAIVRPEVENLGISIVPRGDFGGYNSFDEGEKMYTTKTHLIGRMMVCYGGRIAEEIIIGDISTGASGDLKKASEIAYNMVYSYAMTDNSKMVNFNVQSNNFDAKCMEEAGKICDRYYDETKNIVASNKELITRLATLLCEKEHLSQKEVREFWSANGLHAKRLVEVKIAVNQ